MDFDWNDLKAFEAVAQAGSLTEAARRENGSVATLSRRVESLERTLGLKLILRSPGGMTLTEIGKTFLKEAERAHLAIDEVVRLAKALRDGRDKSPVRISATETVVTTLLAPNLPQLCQSQNAPKVDLIVSNEIADLSRREADLAVRLARPHQNTLMAKKLGLVNTSLYASKAYLEKAPFSERASADHAYILYDDRFGDIPEVIWAEQNNLNQSAIMYSSSTLAMLEAVSAGTGIGLLPDYLGSHRGLVRLKFPTPPQRPLWLVFHRDMKLNPEIKRVRDWISESIKLGLKTK